MHNPHWDKVRTLDDNENSVYSLAIIREVNAEIHEVISAKARLINDLLQHRLVNLIWNIAEHDLRFVRFHDIGRQCSHTYCCTDIDALSDAVDIDVVMMRVCRIVLMTVSGMVCFGGIRATAIWTIVVITSWTR